MATEKKAPKAAKSDAKKTDLSAMSIADLNKKAAELREEAITLKRNTLMGDVQNVRAYKLKRRELAQVLTASNRKAKEEEKK